MNKLLNIFIGLAIYTPACVWGYYVANSEGNNSLGDGSIFDWVIFFILIILPLFVMTRVRLKGDDD